jgi:DnaK suppressor protein
MAAKKTASKKPGKKAPAKKVTVKKTVTVKAASKKAAPKKPVAKKAPAKTAVPKKAVAKKPAAKKPAAKKPAAKKAASKTTVNKKAPAKKAASKTTANKKAPAKTAAPKRTVSKKSAVKATAAIKSPTKKASTPAAGKTKGPSGAIHGVNPYSPRRGESYMSDEQLEHFRTILLNWKRELMEEVDRTVHHMQDEAANFPDPNDRATQESEFGLELRTRDRERKLLKKIESAIKRIDDGSYGYCEETGDEIGLKRLEARPVATLSLEAQERRELAERQFRDRDDRYR